MSFGYDMNFETGVRKLERLARTCRADWVGKDGIWAVYQDEQESYIVVRVEGEARPDWLPEYVEDIYVLCQHHPKRL